MKKLLFVAVLLTAGFVGQSFASAQPSQSAGALFQTALIQLVNAAIAQKITTFRPFIDALNAPTGDMATQFLNLKTYAQNLGISDISILITLLENLSNGTSGTLPLGGDTTGKINNYLYQINNNWNLSKYILSNGTGILTEFAKYNLSLVDQNAAKTGCYVYAVSSTQKNAFFNYLVPLDNESLTISDGPSNISPTQYMLDIHSNIILGSDGTSYNQNYITQKGTIPLKTLLSDYLTSRCSGVAFPTN